MFLSLSLSASACLFFCLSVSLSLCFSLSFSLSFSISLYLSLPPSALGNLLEKVLKHRLSFLPLSFSLSLSVCPSISLSLSFCVSLSNSLFIYFSVSTFNDNVNKRDNAFLRALVLLSLSLPSLPLFTLFHVVSQTELDNF
jgi:hypothetical protein